jgi:excinuclease ABC subunit A
MKKSEIIVERASMHNLRGVSCSIPHNCMCCVTGVSGSGKSTFAFDTLFVEGQRRYVQSLSSHAKRIIGSLPKPVVDAIHGLTPTIAVAQKTSIGSPRSTVGTLTEIYDHLRLLYAKIATPYCPESNNPLTSQSRIEISDGVLKSFTREKIYILAPWAKQKKGALKEDLAEIERKGFVRILLDGKVVKISDLDDIDGADAHDIDVIVDRVDVDQKHKKRIDDSIATALEIGKGIMMTLSEEGNTELYSEFAYSKATGKSYPPLEPEDFSFNSPRGMCPECQGLGQAYEFVLDKIIDKEKSVSQDFCVIAGSYQTSIYRNIYDNLASLYSFDVTTPWKSLSKEAKHVLLYGTERRWTRMAFIDPKTGSVRYDHVQWRGIINEAKIKYHEAKSDRLKKQLEEYMQHSICPSCHGARIKAYPAASRLFDRTMFDVLQKPIDELIDFFENIRLLPAQSFAKDLLDQIKKRLSFLQQVGLGYLTLDRTTTTLSGGEFQRVQLASHIGSGLTGITYILDEPSIGLHPTDNERLIESLWNLRDKGNTVIVVEHDEDMMRSSDWIIDFGPGAGEFGGKLLYEGPLEKIKLATNSLTSDYLYGRKSVSLPLSSRPSTSLSLSLKNASLHNLKNATLTIPLKRFVAITGVSGSGKSSLLLETLYPALSNHFYRTNLLCGPFESLTGVEHLDKVIHIDQTPIGRTPRSNPGTYSGVFDEIRMLFASLAESKAKGWTSGRFSFNVKEGTCLACHGMGMKKIEMDFLEEAWVDCEECQGKRFDSETLSVLFRGKSIHDVLQMTCHEAIEHFATIPAIKKRLEILCRVGLDYLKLGQPSTTLSGGEAQRLKIAKELTRPATGQTLYILDEPTTGLHWHDLVRLLDVLHELVNRGNSVVVIEHNMELVKTADWVIDIGPGAGKEGGQIIAEGRPEDIAKIHTPTGLSLQKIFSDKHELVINRETTPPPSSSMITIRGARQNNLQNLSLCLPKGKVITVTGPSGSGKGSLAFETLFAEGQRRYIETLSSYARQFIKQMSRASVESIDELSPAIAIEQRQHAANRKSTIGTITEIYDYLRIFWAKVGIPHCPKTGAVIRSITKESVANAIFSWPEGTKVQILAPCHVPNAAAVPLFLQKLKSQGYLRIRLNGRSIHLDEEIPSVPQGRKVKLEVVIDRLKIAHDQYSRILSSVAEAAKIGKNTFFVIKDEEEKFYNLSFAVEETNESYPEITAHTFSFTTSHGMCPECRGLGVLLHLDIAALSSPTTTTAKLLRTWLMDDADDILKNLHIDPSKAIKDLTAKEKKVLFYGSPEATPEKNSPCAWQWLGLQRVFDLIFSNQSKDLDEVIESIPDEWSVFLHENTCPSCNGSRLHPLARNVLIDNLSIADACALPITKMLSWFEDIRARLHLDAALRRVSEEIVQRLKSAISVKIGYLSLDRSAPTLSRGEAQRVRLVSQIGSDLSGLLYVIDEPTVGLHPSEINEFMSLFSRVASLGNTIIAIEHDPQFIALSDHVLELGVDGGKDGGAIIFQGSPRPLQRRRKLSRTIPPDTAKISISSVSCHNLEKYSCSIPTESLVAVVGVSGSGKSTLVFDVIEQAMLKRHLKNGPSFIEGLDQFQKLVVIDQKPLGHSARSDVATFLDLFTLLRQLYASLPLARELGLTGLNFSTKLSRGMCKKCFGLGYQKIDMYFLPTAKVECEDCHGLRLQPTSLRVEYRGKNLGQVLQLSIGEASELFSDQPKILRTLSPAMNLGLHYLLLGQEMATLSTGEAQRLKIARELAKRRRQKTLYLFDEPTSGLHEKEVRSVLQLLHDLRNEQHTIIAVENNIDFISACDYLIEPGTGQAGTPFELSKNHKSSTGPYL